MKQRKYYAVYNRYGLNRVLEPDNGWGVVAYATKAERDRAVLTEGPTGRAITRAEVLRKLGRGYLEHAREEYGIKKAYEG